MKSRATQVLVLVTIAVLTWMIATNWVRPLFFRVDPPRPVAGPEAADPLPPLPESIVEAPITYDLRPVIDSLEAAVPRTYGDLEHRIESTQNTRVKFAFLLKRSPFRIHVSGQTVRVTAEVEYSGRAWYNPPIGPEMEVSCGTHVPRRAILTLETTGALTPEWGVRTHSRVIRIDALSDSSRDRCRLSFLRIDVTDRILEQVRSLLDANLANFDGQVASWPVRPRFEKIWRDLQKPIRLSDSLYITLHPTKAELGAIGASDGTAFANLRLFARPRVTTGPRVKPDFTPLPRLERSTDIGRGAHVLVDASFDYPIATRMLNQALAGRRLDVEGHRIRIRDVVLFGVGEGKVALGVRVSGPVNGRLYFTGTPAFDTTTRQIVVPNLDYDVGTATVLVRGYEWMSNVTLRDFLREKARLPDSLFMRQLSQLAEQGMNRKLRRAEPGSRPGSGGPVSSGCWRRSTRSGCARSPTPT